MGRDDSRLSILRELVSKASCLKSALDGDGDVRASLQETGSPIEYVDLLRDDSAKVLLPRIQGLDANVQAKVEAIFENQATKLEAIFQEKYSLLLSMIHSSTIEPGEFTNKLRVTLIAQIRQYQERLRDSILEILYARISQFKNDVQQAERDASYSSEDEDTSKEKGRGHSKLAIAILEKAFAQTSNITKAEKLKLAAATHLEPRQVTIWFQNRRNRKCVGRKEILDCSNLEEEDSNASRVRKRRLDAKEIEIAPNEPLQKKNRLSNEDSTPEYAALKDCGSHTSNSAGYTGSSDSCLTRASLSSFSGVPSRSLSSQDSCRTPESSFLPSPCQDKDLLQQQLSGQYIFDALGAPTLDLEDLGLDFSDFQFGASPLRFDDLNYWTPVPAALATHSGLTPSVTFGIGMPSVQQPGGPSYDLSQALKDVQSLLTLEANAFNEIAQAGQDVTWTTGSSTADVSHGDSGMLDLQRIHSLSSRSFQSGSCSSKQSPASSVSHSTPTPSSSQADLFDFSLSSLGIDEIVKNNVASFDFGTPLPDDELAHVFAEDIDLSTIASQPHTHFPA